MGVGYNRRRGSRCFYHATAHQHVLAMKVWSKIFIALFLALLNVSATYAQAGQVCGATSELGLLTCHRIDAVYNSWIVRRGQTIYITIPETDVVPHSRGFMILYASTSCFGYSPFRAESSGYFVQIGNQSQWSFTVPGDARADPCTVALGASLHKCVGPNCDPLPQWLENPTNQINFGVDLGSSLVNVFQIELFRWFLAIFVGGLVGSIFLRRIIEAVTTNTETEVVEYQKKKNQKVQEETDEERGEWKDDKTA